MLFKFRKCYTPRQMALLGVLSTKARASIDDLVIALERTTNKPATRQQVTGQIKSMANKLALDGYVMKRTSKLGRGNVGEYVLTTIMIKGE